VRTPTPLLVAAALAAACGDTLVDHHADPHLLAGETCGPALAACGGACVPEDASHCGPTCAVCGGAPPDPNAVPACIDQACGFECRPGTLRVGTSCQRATAVSAGFEHTCAIAGGAVKCWGANDHGQLGDGTRKDQATPVDVPLPDRATSIAAGYVHTCAVAGGAVFCWGDNSTGALGDGTTTLRTSPVQVAGLSGATAVAAGGGENTGGTSTYYGHSCAIAGGTVSCWGGNESGQLGDGTFVARATPAPVAGLGGAPTAIAVGDRHTCALASGAVRCWGENTADELGTGAGPDSATPLTAIASGASAVATGAAHSCAITGDAPGQVLACWGLNGSGQVNGGTDAPGTVPVPLAPALPPGVHPSLVAAGGAHTCALTPGVDGGLVCFGANAQSQLGGPAAPRGMVEVPLAAAQAVAAGFAHTCAILSDGGVQCWGADDHGQLGTGAAGPASATPSYVSGR
jgi:alpha-tubulin suppressor-like RCC1 family protein